MRVCSFRNEVVNSSRMSNQLCINQFFNIIKFTAAIGGYYNICAVLKIVNNNGFFIVGYEGLIKR